MKDLTVDQFRNLTEDNQAVQLFKLLRKSQRSLLGRKEEEENGAGRGEEEENGAGKEEEEENGAGKEGEGNNIAGEEEEGDNGGGRGEEGKNGRGGTRSVEPLWERINNRLAQPKKLNKDTSDSSGKFYLQEPCTTMLFFI